MHLTRCKDQKSASLDEFYKEVSELDNYTNREGGKAMLDLIARLRALPNERHVFGLTSHHRLCLLATDTYRSPWFVIISALDKRNYFVEYLMPEHIAPWPHAYVKGEASSEEAAIQMIVAAIEKSEGWRLKPCRDA
ncbi:MAG: hypothetical protein EPO07_16570 [Verrucomicrobia bacterium]|nr:MAG: hypothetical protein EPO07_16570 [Verrucomicrobiota bacterium]